jgi:hypothetical protein
MNFRPTFVIAASLFAFNFIGISQTTPSSMNAQESATLLTETMVEKLGLNETQKAQVHELNLGVAQKNEAIKNDQNMSSELKEASLKGNNETRLAYLQIILTEEQYTKYLEMEESVKEIKKSKRNIKLEKESLKEEKED